MTNEQRMRGADAGVDWALLVTGYDQEAFTSLSRTRPLAACSSGGLQAFSR